MSETSKELAKVKTLADIESETESIVKAALAIGSGGDLLQSLALALKDEVRHLIKFDTTGHRAGRAIKTAGFVKLELAKIAGDGVADLEKEVDALIGDLRSAQSLLPNV